MINIAKAFQTPVLLPQWLSNGWSTWSRPAVETPTPVVPVTVLIPSALAIQVTPVADPSGINHLQVIGELDRFTYTALIEAAVKLHTQGCRALVLDLRQTTRLELSGLFALVSIARLYNGESLLDPEVGWTALRAAATERTLALGQQVKLLGTPAVIQAIRKASFCDVFEIYDEVAGALAAFTP